MHYCEEYKTVTVNACSDLLNPSLVISNSRQNDKPEEPGEPEEYEEPEVSMELVESKEPGETEESQEHKEHHQARFLLYFYLKATSLCDRVV